MELGHASVVLPSLILIAVANGAPVVFARMLGRRFAAPIDGGFVLREPFEQFDYLRTSRMSHVHSAIENCYV